MSKRLIQLLIFLLTPLLIVVGFSSWIIVGEKNITLGDNYVETAVCHLTLNGVKKDYTRIERALEDANMSPTGGTVYVYPKTSTKIYKDCTIGDNVSLILPYDGTTYANRDGTGKVDDFADSSDNGKLVTSVEVSEGVTITMGDNANLIIGGVLGHENNGISGHTSGLYTQIVLEKFSKIIIPETSSGAIIDCYGYIKESEYNNESEVIAYKGTINMPFVIYDYRAGQNTVSVYSGSDTVDPICPFNQYDMPNIQPKFKIYSEAYLYGYVDLYTGATSMAGITVPAQHNKEKTAIISPKTTSLITLEYGSRVECKYKGENVKYTKKDYGTTTLDFYGGAQLNSMSLSISVVGVTASISTSNVFFPVNWRFTINLYDGLYFFNNKIKFLPGSSLYIHNEATLSVQSDLIFYEKFEDVNYNNGFYPVKNEAMLINNGILNISSSANFGGKILVEENKARIINSSLSSSVKSVEAYGVLDTSNKITFGVAVLSKNFKSVTIITPVQTTELYPRGYIDSVSNLDIFKSESVYDSNDKYWIINEDIYKYYIEFNANGGSSISKQTFVFMPGDSLEISSIIDSQYIPKRKGYKFDGWYRDSELTQKAAGSELSVSNNETVRLYAKWTKDLSQIYDLKIDASSETIEGNSPVTKSATVNATNIDGNKIELTSIVWNEVSDDNNILDFPEDTLNKETINVTITPKSKDKQEAKISVTVTDIYGNVETATHTFAADQDGCLLPGTLVTMADGTKKPVEQIQPGDELKVFNHYTGEYDVSPVVFNDSEPKANVNVINLEFSNGSNIGVVYEHGFFDLDLMKYVYIDEYNYNDYIGHRFYSDGNNIVTLNRAYITTEYTEVYSPVTAYHLNYFTEDILSMPGGIEGLFNIFEYDDDLKYNEELMKQDIETYGLYTYDDFKDYCSYEFYQAFPAEYLKVAVGKGYITFDEIIYLINRYKNKV